MCDSCYPFDDLELVKRHTWVLEGDWDIYYSEDSRGNPVDVIAERELPDGKLRLMYVDDGELVFETVDRPVHEFDAAVSNLGAAIAEELRLEYYFTEYMVEIIAFAFFVLGLIAGRVIWGPPPAP